MPFDINLDAQFEVYICSCCSNCFPMTKKVSMNLLHENCHHSDFGPSFMGLHAGACGLGNLCVNKGTIPLNRGCNKCNTIIHSGECMKIHERIKLEEEKTKWVQSNKEVVIDHYKYLLKNDILSKEEYKKKLQELFKL